MSVAIVAFGAVSGLGTGRAAISAGEIGAPARVAIANDEALSARGLARPFASRVAKTPLGAAELLSRALAECIAGLDVELPDWRSRRIGLALGTSSGSMLSAEAVLSDLAAGREPPADAVLGASYFAPQAQVVRAVGKSLSPATLVLTACAASTTAIGIATRWLTHDACDLVLAGGFDEVSTFVASGFEVLRATTGTVPPRPFAHGRDGMSLGEGAGMVALVRAKELPRAKVFVSGFGASADAVHLTAPDRTGAGLARAAKAALDDAQIAGERVELVSNHATATPFNDAAETSAMRLALGPSAKPVLFAYKAQIGHTLGAAGVLETLACVDAMERGVVPATPVTSELEPELPGRVLTAAESGNVDVTLKLSAAFGGCNAALVLTRSPRAARASARDVYVSRAVSVATTPTAAELASALGQPAEKFARTDGLVRLGLGACAKLEANVGKLARDTGVIVGHALATLETNVAFAERLRERGPRSVEPRKFPYTSPNAVAGECGAAFGWTGPGLAVGAGLHGAVEALAVAIDLVRSGDVERMVVLGIDEIGAASRAWLRAALGDDSILREGAVALVVSATPEHAIARVVESGMHISSDAPGRPTTACGHRALLALTSEAVPARIEASCPWGGAAWIGLSPVKI